MNNIKTLISATGISLMLLVSSCGNNKDIHRLFQKVRNDKITSFSYKGEIFKAVELGTNGAWIRLEGEHGRHITIKNGTFDTRVITNNGEEINLYEINPVIK